jgi:NADPH-ferrihemoprotein reductase
LLDVYIFQKYPGGHLSVYFASQTGTAETFAKQLEREGADHGFLVHVIDLEDVNIDQLLSTERTDDSISKAVFLCSTYGEGEPTDNAASFVMELKSRISISSRFGEEEKKEVDSPSIDPCLSGLKYCVFGLGNKQYEHYNAMGKFFDSTLESLGASRIAPLGLGNDDEDLEADFEAWKDNVLWPFLKKKYVKEGTAIVHKRTHDLPETPYHVEYLEKITKQDKLSHDEIHSSGRHYFTSFDCPVTANRELRNISDPGSTVHIEIDVSKAKGFSYHSADNLGVLPVNSDSVVELVAATLNYDLDAVFRIKAAPNHEWHGAPFPMPITVRECLTRYCDLTGAPRRSDLKLLASYATDQVDKKALLRMASKEGRAEYREKILEAHVGLVDLLRLCPSIEAPLEHFLAFCPRLLPRFYTISSSSSVHPRSVHLTVAVTETKKKDGSVFKGICSTYLAGLAAHKSMVRVFNRESTFRLPTDPTRPIIMIGPGTGVAPMRALLQEREYQHKVMKHKVGLNVLYFGCKISSMDYLYEDEMTKFKADGILHKMYVAFSREQAEKVYVQHLLVENAEETWDLINSEGAYIYVCGGVKMGHDVSEALRSICVTRGKLSLDSAKTYMDELASEGRYVQELWA